MYRYCKVWRSSAYVGSYLDEDDGGSEGEKKREREKRRKIDTQIESKRERTIVEDREREIRRE